MENEIKRGRKKKEIDGNFAKLLSELLQKIKAENGIIQDDVAKSIGVSRQALGKWANGETVPDIIDLKKLARYFNISADYLLGLNDIQTTNPDLIMACKYTGLDENTINTIAKITKNYPTVWIELFINKYFDKILSEILGTFAIFDDNTLWQFQISHGQNGFEKEIKPNCKELTQNEIKQAYTKWLMNWLDMCIYWAVGHIKNYIIELNNLEIKEFQSNIDKISSELYNYYVLEAAKNGEHNPPKE